MTEHQRYQLAALRKEGRRQNTIAANLGVHPSTISRELLRNRGQRGYWPHQAHQKTRQRRQEATKAVKMTPTSGIVSDGGAQVIVEVDRELLSQGENRGSIVVTGAGDKIVIPVTALTLARCGDERGFRLLVDYLEDVHYLLAQYACRELDSMLGEGCGYDAERLRSHIARLKFPLEPIPRPPEEVEW